MANEMSTIDPPREAGGGRVAGLLAGRRLLPIWTAALVMAVLFTLFRAGMMIANYADLDGAGPGAVARALLIGLGYDLAAIACALGPLAVVLMLAPNAAFRRRWFNRLAAVYATGVVVLTLGVEIAGAAFFQHYGERLNWKALDYYSEYRVVGAYIWRRYPVVWLVLGLIVVAWCLGRWFTRRCARAPAPADGQKTRALGGVVMLGLVLLAIRGPTVTRPLLVATFADNNAMCQLATNNFFAISSAASSLTEGARNETREYALPPADEAMARAAGLLIQPSDAPAPFPGNPLWRRSHPAGTLGDVNVVVIIMEGMAGEPVGALDHSPTYTPYFDGLCRDGLTFDRMYAIGGRTNHGVVGVLCGYPDLGRGSVMKSPRAVGKFLTLPLVFADRGYDTLFVYGGDPNFDNMGAFLRAGGVQTVLGQEAMNAGPLLTEWGAFDEVTLRRAHEAFVAEGDRRFFATVLTLTNHEPFEVPPGRCPMVADKSDPEKASQLNAFRYADWALEEFFRLARSADYFEKTIFVLVSDHGRNFNRRRIMDCPGYRVPCVIYAPNRLAAGRIDTVASQTDIAPTLLALLGWSTEHCWMGRNVLEVPAGEGMALLQEGDRLALVRSDRTAVLLPSGEVRLFATDPTAMDRIEPVGPEGERLAEMRRDLLALYTTGWNLYLTSAYRSPAYALARR